MDVTSVAVSRPTILVLGSEGGGMRTNVRRACERLVCVPRAAGAGGLAEEDADAGIESLNVSVAAALLLNTLLSSARGVVAAGGASA